MNKKDIEKETVKVIDALSDRVDSVVRQIETGLQPYKNVKEPLMMTILVITIVKWIKRKPEHITKEELTEAFIKALRLTMKASSDNEQGS
jgi:hypothetical protein